MTKDLHRISAFFFYVLGSSFFVAYLLLRNELYEPWPEWWMKVADLPLLLVAVLFGGTSLYLSVKPADGPARIHPLVIAVPLVALFLALVVLNFWVLFA